VQPGRVNDLQLAIPSTVTKPHYAKYGTGSPDGQGALHPEPEHPDVIAKSRVSNQLVCKVLNRAKEICENPTAGIGVEGAGDGDVNVLTTEYLDAVLHKYMVEELNSYPSPLNYSGFPKSICTSVNNVVCHGIPDTRPLRKGDIINVDVSLYHNGVHGDASDMYVIGGPEGADENLLALIQTTRDCLDAAIDICKPGTPYSAIGQLIENKANDQGFSVCAFFAGHGIAREFHQSPLINHVRNHDPYVMVPGMIFTIEPVLMENSADIEFWDDGWTAVSCDGGYSAQVEHTILITNDGCEILTK